MSQIFRPIVPFRAPISGGLHEGKRIKIKGHAPYGADRFTVNLMTGLLPSSDRPLHISVRFGGNIVVRNTLQQNSYGAEERCGSFPFARGNNFTLVIQVGRSAYNISVNGTHCWDYSHRLPYSSVSSIMIDGDVTIERIEYINKISPCPAVYTPPSPANLGGSFSVPALPCLFPIHGGIRPGMSIYIGGRPTGSPHKFSINLQNGAATSPPPDIAFHFDVRFFNYTVVRNSRVNNVWSSEETMISYFPFQPGSNFDMIIKIDQAMYVIMLNGQHFLTFRHRLTSFPRFNVVSIENDVIVTSIRYS